jgi:hypothetical protein
VPRRAREGEINYPAFDRFAWAHAFMGGMLAIGGVPAWAALGASVTWELLEPTVKQNYPTIFPRQSLDTTANKIGDSTAWMAGWLVGYAMTRPASRD